MGSPTRLVGASNKWNASLCGRMVFALLEHYVRLDGALRLYRQNFGSARMSGVHAVGAPRLCGWEVSVGTSSVRADEASY